MMQGDFQSNKARLLQRRAELDVQIPDDAAANPDTVTGTSTNHQLDDDPFDAHYSSVMEGDDSMPSKRPRLSSNPTDDGDIGIAGCEFSSAITSDDTFRSICRAEGLRPFGRPSYRCDVSPRLLFRDN